MDVAHTEIIDYTLHIYTEHSQIDTTQCVCKKQPFRSEMIFSWNYQEGITQILGVPYILAFEGCLKINFTCLYPCTLCCSDVTHHIKTNQFPSTTCFSFKNLAFAVKDGNSYCLQLKKTHPSH